MGDHIETRKQVPADAGAKPGRPKALWLKYRWRLTRSRTVMAAGARLVALWFRFVRLTNPFMKGSETLDGDYADHLPCILALWHGQHLLAPAAYPSKRSLVAMVSRSADAEINAMVLERFGVEAVRGSGGREHARSHDKGGARALIALKRALEAGKNVCMIADIPHGKPRDAGMGVILLARLSGRPIIGGAIVTSRRKVLEGTWDKTTINLPFGRGAMIAAPPLYVPADADEAEMEAKRREFTAALNEATAKAYAMVDGRR